MLKKKQKLLCDLCAEMQHFPHSGRSRSIRMGLENKT